jgi:predicted RecB family nuclease
MLYNYVQCPHRVSLDLFGNSTEKDPVSVFVQLLWEKGNAFEREVIENLKLPFCDLSSYSKEEKETATLEAMRRGDELIYAGRIVSGNLLGEPDLLRRQYGGYVAGDIKSGAAEEDASEEEEGKPKKHYAVQLALYTDILEKLNVSGGRTPFVWDIHNQEVVYDLDALQGKRNPTSLWTIYRDVLSQVKSIIETKEETLAAYSSKCKLCHWRTVCIKAVTATKDLTLIPELGRSKRDSMLPYIKNLTELANTDISGFIKGKRTVISGIGPDTLVKFQSRAQLQMKNGAKPYCTGEICFPVSALEIFFDIETDPMRDICYLHGFVERRNLDNATEKYVAFFAHSPTSEEEEKAFAEAWRYIKSSRPFAMYYYSKYERTIWRKLQQKYPHVVTPEEIEELFDPKQSIDLYFDVVKPKTEWPTRDYSIKTLATYLGFSWRDTDPSGASSIEWYHRWVETGDDAIRQRILQYNEDDCIATRVLLDGIRSL